MTIRSDYNARFETVLKPLAVALNDFLVECLEGEARIDRIGARPKSVDRFVVKAETLTDDGTRKYDAPLDQIQDQVGARVTVFYKSDVTRVKEHLLKYLRPTEAKDLVPVSEWQFGYFGFHAVCLFPREVISPEWSTEMIPQFFELQIKTLFQHAWSEANHDLGYKPEGDALTSDQVRMLAFTSAQAWGADRAFDELFCDLHSGGGLHR